MKDYRTKAELLTEIAAYKEVLDLRNHQIRLARSEKVEAEAERAHYKHEAARISEIATLLDREVNRQREKYGDLVTTSQNALVSSVEVLRTVRPRLDRSEALHSLNKQNNLAVKKYGEMPF